MIGQLLLAFISTFAFAILFSAPRSQYFARGLCGCFTWGMYLLFQKFGNSVVIAALFATFFVTVLARILSIIKSSRYYLSGNRNPSFSSGCRNLLYFLPPDHESRQNGCLYGAGNFQDGGCHCTGYYLRFCDTDEMDTEISEMLVGVFLFPAIPTDMLRFLFVPHAFLLMFCATRPTGSNRHKT